MRITVESYSEQIVEPIRVVRHAVFTEEQGIPASLDFDGQDRHAVHALAFKEGRVVGTARMLPDGHIGRVAVLNAYRHQGLGTRMIRALIEHAQECGYERIYLASQERAIGFYVKLGFVSRGDRFLEAGIPHQSMEMRP